MRKSRWGVSNPLLVPEVTIWLAGIVMEALSNSSTISEVCRKYNVASFAVYKWRDEFISAGTAAMAHGKSTMESSLTRKINSRE